MQRTGPMFPVTRTQQRASEQQRQRQTLTWETITFPISPNFRSKFSCARELSMKDPKWILTRDRVESIIDYEFRNAELLREAMYPVQKGWARIVDGVHNRTFKEGNRRLAHIGDAVLKVMAVDTWFWRMQTAKELHKELQRFHTNKIMNEIAQKKGLSKVIAVWFQHGVIEGSKTEATTVEAIIGAVWFDSGMNMDVMRKLLDLLLGTNLVSEHEAHCRHVR